MYILNPFYYLIVLGCFLVEKCRGKKSKNSKESPPQHPNGPYFGASSGTGNHLSKIIHEHEKNPKNKNIHISWHSYTDIKSIRYNACSYLKYSALYLEHLLDALTEIRDNEYLDTLKDNISVDELDRARCNIEAAIIIVEDLKESAFNLEIDVNNLNDTLSAIDELLIWRN